MKLRQYAFLLPIAAALLVSGCFRQDIKTIVVSVPGLKSPECSKIIQDAMVKVEGILEVTPDVTAHTVTVRFDSTRMAIKNIEFVIATAGFDANTTLSPPETKATLPPGCR
ncbi:MAG: heavy-metal-associated domain-containing protein [bacterium]